MTANVQVESARSESKLRVGVKVESESRVGFIYSAVERGVGKVEVSAGTTR
jgi:hypothetical protein